MLLRNSIINTKKFFQKTIDNFKSFLSIGSTYQRLPKTPPFHPFSCGCDAKEIDNDAGYENELDNFYNEFTHQWDSTRKRKVKNKAEKKTVVRVLSKKNQNQNQNQQFLLQNCQKESCNFAARTEETMKNPEKNDDFDKRGYILKENNAENEDVSKSKRYNISPGILRKPELCSRSVRENRLCFVAEKLKELEMMDKGNVDHNKLDFEEFLHHYSRLTCPAYLDIVDKFLMEMSTEFFGPQACPKVTCSRPVLQALKV